MAKEEEEEEEEEEEITERKAQSQRQAKQITAPRISMHRSTQVSLFPSFQLRLSLSPSFFSAKQSHRETAFPTHTKAKHHQVIPPPFINITLFLYSSVAAPGTCTPRNGSCEGRQ
jgi:hypothetical protein